jgi:hypothetical protein
MSATVGQLKSQNVDSVAPDALRDRLTAGKHTSWYVYAAVTQSKVSAIRFATLCRQRVSLKDCIDDQCRSHDCFENSFGHVPATGRRQRQH